VTGPWTPSTWRERRAEQQPPWPDDVAVERALKQIASFPTRKSPMGFGFAPGGTHAYLCCHDDAEVFEFELASGHVTRTFATAAGCEFVVAYQ